MKKLFTLIAAFSCLSLAANAQRKIDLDATNMVSPAAGTAISSGSSVAIKVIVKNVGTVPLKSTDSLVYQITWGTGTITIGGYSAFILPQGKTLNQNDTFMLNIALNNLNFTAAADETVDLCVTVIPANRTADSVRDMVTTNNKGCKSTVRKKSAGGGTSVGYTASLAQYNVAVYPNPAQAVANFQVDMNGTEDVTVQIYDMTGRLVISENKGKMNGNNTIAVNTEMLKAGVYLYRVNIGSEVRTGKLMISNQ